MRFPRNGIPFVNKIANTPQKMPTFCSWKTLKILCKIKEPYRYSYNKTKVQIQINLSELANVVGPLWRGIIKFCGYFTCIRIK